MVESAVPTSAPRLRLLDLARLAAALSVVVFHFAGRSSWAWDQPIEQVFPGLSAVTKYGALGVYFFFMISGFVILMSAWGRTPAQFAASRISRLYPAYWFAVLVTGALLFVDRSIHIGGDWDRVGVTGVIANLTMFQTALGIPHVEGVYWTLWVELKFYILLGLLMLLKPTARQLVLFTVAWPLAGAIARVAGEPLLIEVLQPDYAPYFGIGMALYLLHREGRSLIATGALALNTVLAVGLAKTSVLPFYQGIAGVTLSPTVVAVLLVAMVGLLAAITLTRLASVGWRWLTVAGALTYPLYLLHEVWGWELIRFLSPAVPKYLTVGITIVAALVVAYLVHRFIERPFAAPFRRLLERAFSGAPRPAAAPPAAPSLALNRHSSVQQARRARPSLFRRIPTVEREAAAAE